MRRFLSMILLVASILPSFAQDPAPQLVCTNAIWNMGVISPTDSVSHTFILENKGSSDLTIENIKACCGANTTLGTNVIKAGESTTLTLSLSIQGKTSIQKSLYIKSNDPNQIYYQLQIIGTIGEENNASLYAIPNELNLGNVLKDGTVSGKATIYPKDNAATNATLDISTDVPWLNASLGTGSNGAIGEILVTSIPPLEEGRHEGNVIIGSLKIPVTLQVIPELFAEPDVVILPMSGGTADYTRYVSIRTQGSADFQITLTKTNLSDDVAIDSMVLPGAGYRITLTQLKPANIEDGAALIIVTTCKNTPRLIIPIKVE